MPTSIVTITEALDARRLGEGIFRLPRGLLNEAMARLGEKIVLAHRAENGVRRYVGTARVAGVEVDDADPVASVLFTVRDMQLFRSAIIAEDAFNDVIGPIPGDGWRHMQDRLGRIAEFAEPPQAAYDTPPMSGREEIFQALLEAADWRCAFTSMPIDPRDGDLAAFVVRIVPRAFGGDDRPGNLLVASPAAGRAFAAGRLTVNEDHSLVVSLADIDAELRRALNSKGRLVVPQGPFAADDAALRFHRERIFGYPALDA